ncbi:MAG: benzoyl-CoA 2,3-epoxidase subunit BoxB [SAR324 cluster bacterium]|nr:benzoyl-CoA 2,3-epoxidase subunit BoxB [SAR324 cluster bacterium]
MLDSIPNNVNLENNPKLQRALQRWNPNFLDWWREMGPGGFQEDRIYLRTAIGVGQGGWANYDYVTMPEYRWGIFLANPRQGETIHFGDHVGVPYWDQVPGEHRKDLRRLVVTQGDTEPASVEQQRLLGQCAPSLLDLRNLFQVNVEEARHLWAMVYLLHSYFGVDGRDEAEEMLERRSGHPDRPRILDAFNKPISDWLALFCFTTFTDRDGKYQLASLAESGFDPLARTTQFMLMEEAFHMAVGETGIARVIKRTAELMREGKDPESVGAIPLPVVQRYVNEWATASYDLFGSEDSSNAAAFFAAGLKGRYQESDNSRYPDHVALDDVFEAKIFEEGSWTTRQIPLRRAMNACLLDAYVADCKRVLERWNAVLKEHELSERITLPSVRFGRRMGIYSGQCYDIEGNPSDEQTLQSRMVDWLPSQADYDLVKRSMVPVYEPGKIANWIAPQAKGVGGQELDFEYVQFH